MCDVIHVEQAKTLFKSDLVYTVNYENVESNRNVVGSVTR